jgi:hypothetical protein
MSRKKKAAGAPENNGRAHDESAQLQELLNSFDPEALAALLDAAGDVPLDEDAANFFDDFLSACIGGKMNEAEREESAEPLIATLVNLRIGADGGDRIAREQLAEIREMIEESVAADELSLDALMTIGRVLVDADLEVPDSLKKEVVNKMGQAPVGGSVSDLTASFVEMAEGAGLDTFGAYEQLSKTLAIFPPDDALAVLKALVLAGHPVLDRAIAGFALHKDAALAEAALGGLAARPADEEVQRLLARMRPWLSRERLKWIDAAIKAAPGLADAGASRAGQLHKCYASACDASGVCSLLATRKEGGKYQAVLFMLKPTGLAEVLVLGLVDKQNLDAICHGASLGAPLSEIAFPIFMRFLGLSLGENLAAGTLPPFSLVAAAEALDLPPAAPIESAPADIIDRLLSEFPAKARAPAKEGELDSHVMAHAAAVAWEHTQTWFEGGPEIDALFAKVKGKKRRTEAVLKSHLPGRRDFWARQCALSALALHSKDPTHPMWRALAVVGRDLAAGEPLDKIPLMRSVAELTAEYYAAG